MVSDNENLEKDKETAVIEETEKVDESARDKDSDLASGDSPDFKWYVAHAMTGYENRVAKTLKERILTRGFADYFAEILIPEEEVVSNVGGKKRRLKKKFFPGYVLLKMIMNDDTWHLVVDTDKITGFIGGTKGKPDPISDAEAAYLTNQAEEGFKKPRGNFDFVEGESVKVTEGPFASFVGTVEHVSEKGKIRVQVSIFGRPTPVELDYTQIEKV